MEVVIRIPLYIRRTNACITHNRRSTTRLNGSSSVAIAIIVLGVVHVELMPHFVGDIVNVKGISNRGTRTRYSAGFSRRTHNTKSGKTSGVCTEDMADIIVCRADIVINNRDIFIDHSSCIPIGEWITSCISIDI